jgi:fermentation-respiration switch protein FrsA (DUF1100 family)
LAQSVTRNYFVKPLGWLLMHVGLPLASAQTGADLTDFSPADRAADLWPRPLLLIHGGRDPIIPIHHGWALYNRAVQPKYQLFLDNGEHNDVLNHEGAAPGWVLRFLPFGASCAGNLNLWRGVFPRSCGRLRRVLRI